MPDEQTQPAAKPSPKLSLDTWAVLLALLAAALIRLGAIQHIPW
jgi:hypothetical protein